MSFKDIVSEYARIGLGPAILQDIFHLTRSVVRSYDPVVYGQVWRWDEGLDDLVQEFCVYVLLEQGQLDYAIVVAVDHTHFRRLLARQLRHHLARRRRRTIVDNLLDRCRQLVSSAPFTVVTTRPGWSYTLEGKKVEPGPAPPSALEAIAGRLATLPKAGANPDHRAPAVYSTDSLRQLLVVTADSLPCAVTAANLDRILNLLLTCWVPRLLQKNESESALRDSPALSAEDRAIVRDLAESIASSCMGADREVLRLKLTGMSDGDIGRRLGVSRPTVAKKKHRVLSGLQAALAPLDEGLRIAVLECLGDHLVDSRSGENDE